LDFRFINIRVRVLDYILVAVAAYLLGSIPTGYLVAKARGVDIRHAGSGNIGATNAFRTVGKGAGAFVLLVDIFKGWFAVAVAAPLLGQLLDAAPAGYLRITAAVLVIVGHNYTCWLGFKGGKGIATSAGAVGALAPYALLVILGVWVVLFVLTRFVSIGSIAAAVALPFAAWFTAGHDAALTTATAIMAALAIYRHRRNIQRLIEGTEHRVQFKKKEAAS
jgi:acyl phosphate:glycerol-3-phosphate acyltransferase